jgi:maleamate amidohydrolase
VAADDARAQDYGAAGFMGRIGGGRSPAVIVIDVCEAYLGDGPFADAGGRFEAARASAERIVAAARAAGHPVVFTQVVLAPGAADAGWFGVKVPGLVAFEAGSPYAAFPPAPAPLPGETVVTKQYASAFFGSSLASTLRYLGVDTTITLGFSTSGCVRATTLDALQHGFRPLVAREACGDRDVEVNDRNLFDLDAKYADVLSEAEILTYLSQTGTL